MHGITATFIDDGTHHRVAAPFWEFMNSSGPLYEDDRILIAPLFLNPFYTTGRPSTEAYWATVKVAGAYQDVLTQWFERRCLTYTPDNPEGWQVEAGNCRRHCQSRQNVKLGLTERGMEVPRLVNEGLTDAQITE